MYANSWQTDPHPLYATTCWLPEGGHLVEVQLHFPKLKEEQILLHIISEQVGNYGGYTEYNVGIKFLHCLFLLQQKYSNVAFPKGICPN